jgi:hypothetical protein
MPNPPSFMPTPAGTNVGTPQASATPMNLGTPEDSAPPSRSGSPPSAKPGPPRISIMGVQEDGMSDKSPVGDQPLTIGKPHVNPLE